ncbi:HD domain-containing protein [Fodinicola acaciae]|uniref:HD domain-containing protein n=1 Tax=Fodinicola acaciae TaxID=2681555 RepID=UPI001FE79BE4|nr:HD domain-containing protein [Fodinicola acaciae]
MVEVRLQEAKALAEALVSSLGDRWKHLQAVGARAAVLAPAVPEDDGELLVMAGWLHDIGYAPEIARMGFHSLDGAVHLRELGYPERLVCLVAHHTGARFEAAERGLSAELAAFELEDGPTMDALVCADLTTGPQGQPLSFDERMAEILRRYDEDSPVHRAITAARESLAGSVDRTRRRLADVGLGSVF